MRKIYVAFLALVAGAALAVPWNQVPRHTDVNTNIVGAVVGEGLTLTNGEIRATGGGGADGQTVTNIVESLAPVYDDDGYVPQLKVRDHLDVQGGINSLYLTDLGESGKPALYGGTWEYRPEEGLEGDREVVVKDNLAPYARSADLGTAAFRDANDFATKADEQLIYQLVIGSNVVAEVTNYNSRVRAPSFRLLQLDPVTKKYFTVWAETNGLTRTLNEAKAYADGATNALGLAKADRAWSKHTSGLGADAPEGVTWISTPETVIAGGYEYERHVTSHGEVWVLTSNGMGLGGDSNAYFRVSTPDGETLFSIEKTDEQIVGVLTDGISVSGGVVTLNVGVVTYNGQAPICMASQSVTGPWSDLSEGRPAWISSVATNGVNGAWSFELESTASAAFFYFLVRQPGATVIKNSAQTNLSGGILVEGTRFYPHKSGSTLTWTTTP